MQCLSSGRPTPSPAPFFACYSRASSIEGFQLPATLRGFLVKCHKDKIRNRASFFPPSLEQLLRNRHQLRNTPSQVSDTRPKRRLGLISYRHSCLFRPSPLASLEQKKTMPFTPAFSPFSSLPSPFQTCDPRKMAQVL